MKTALRQVDGEPFFRVIIIGQSGRRVIDNCAHNAERCCGSSVKDRASSSLRKANVMGERDRNDAWEAAERERLAKELVETVVRMGYPEEFGHAIVQNLRTEKTMSRMIGYLKHAKPRSAEEIADEMLAIMEDRKRWSQKKEAEYDNSKDNEMLYFGLGVDEEE